MQAQMAGIASPCMAATSPLRCVVRWYWGCDASHPITPLLPFSMQRFLGAVTYGATGTEYTALNCSVVQDHVAIRCVTGPGTGRFLRWTVTVGGQTSAASANVTSYAAPRITSLVPSSLATPGGVAAVLTGFDFASRYSAAKVQVFVNNFNLAPPSQAEMDSFAAQMLVGPNADIASLVEPAVALFTVQSWIASLTEITSLAKVALPAKSAGSLSFTLPSGFGPSLAALVLVDGVPSNVVNFS